MKTFEKKIIDWLRSFLGIYNEDEKNRLALDRKIIADYKFEDRWDWRSFFEWMDSNSVNNPYTMKNSEIKPYMSYSKRCTSDFFKQFSRETIEYFYEKSGSDIWHNNLKRKIKYYPSVIERIENEKQSTKENQGS